MMKPRGDLNPKGETGFAKIGFDLLIDENMKVWMIEMNHTPMLTQVRSLSNWVANIFLSDYHTILGVRVAGMDQQENWKPV